MPDMNNSTRSRRAADQPDSEIAHGPAVDAASAVRQTPS